MSFVRINGCPKLFHSDEIKVVFKFPNRKFKGVWWMPRLQRGDEGRDMAAIRYGEMPSNL